MKIKKITPLTIYKIETDEGSFIRVSENEYHEINKDSDGQFYFDELYDYPECEYYFQESLQEMNPDIIGNPDDDPDNQVNLNHLPLYI